MTPATSLQEEVTLYEEKKPLFLERFPGLFVVVRGADWSGPYSNIEAAYTAALDTYGLEPFLVKHVLAEEPVSYVPVLYSTSATGS